MKALICLLLVSRNVNAWLWTDEQCDTALSALCQAEIDNLTITWSKPDPECETGTLPSVMCGDLDCELYHELSPACHCAFASCNENCQVEDSFIEYVQSALCSSSHWNNKAIHKNDTTKEEIECSECPSFKECGNCGSESYVIGVQVAYFIWLMYLFIALGMTADAFFVPILTRISDLLGLSEEVAGVTLVALGNGAPDIFAAIASYSNSDPTVAKMAVGALIGAGIFVVCVVAGACMIIVPFEPANWPLTRDIVTYMWAVYWLIYCMWKGEISLFDAIGFLVYYFIYVAVVVIWSKFGPKKNKISPNGELAEKNEVPGTPASLRSQSKNRVRSATNASERDEKRDSKRSSISSMSSKSSKESVFERTWFGEIKRAFTPWDPEEFEGCDGIFFSIIMAPVYLIIKLTVPVIDDEEESWNYPLTIIQSLAAPFMFYVLLEQYEEDEFGVDDNCGLDDESDCEGFPRWAIPIIIGFFFCLMTVIFGSLHKPPVFKNIYIILGMITAMLWIGVEANEIVGLLTALGIFWKIPSAIMGLTFLAWANSIGDLVADISLAKLGKAKTAVAACFGSPLLNVLFGTGIGCLAGILGGQSGDDIPLDLGPLEMTLSYSMMIVLISLLFILPITKFKAGKPLGIYLILFYGASLGLCIYFGAIKND